MVKFPPRSLYPRKNPGSQRCWRREKSLAPTGIRVLDHSARSQVALPTVRNSLYGNTLFLFRDLTKIVRSEWESHARDLNHLLAGRTGERWRAEEITSLWFPFVTSKCFSFRKSPSHPAVDRSAAWCRGCCSIESLTIAIRAALGPLM